MLTFNLFFSNVANIVISRQANNVKTINVTVYVSINPLKKHDEILLPLPVF